MLSKSEGPLSSFSRWHALAPTCLFNTIGVDLYFREIVVLSSTSIWHSLFPSFVFVVYFSSTSICPYLFPSLALIVVLTIRCVSFRVARGILLVCRMLFPLVRFVNISIFPRVVWLCSLPLCISLSLVCSAVLCPFETRGFFLSWNIFLYSMFCLLYVLLILYMVL